MNYEIAYGIDDTLRTLVYVVPDSFEIFGLKACLHHPGSLDNILLHHIQICLLRTTSYIGRNYLGAMPA